MIFIWKVHIEQGCQHGPKLDQIGIIWDKSGIFKISCQYILTLFDSVHFDSV